jgi:hypothetical protein
MAKASPLNIVTANHLLEGTSVFLSEHGWTTDHFAARIAGNAEEAAALEKLGLADEAANKVVGVYLVAVTLGEDGRPEPIHYREKMRVLARPSFWTDALKSQAARGMSGGGDTQHVSL